MNKNALIVVAAVVIVGGLALVLMQNSQKDSAMMEQKALEEKTMMEKKAMEEQAMMEKEGAMKEGEAMMKKDEAMTSADSMMSKGSYQLYDESKLALAEKGNVVLFFKASWCPTCRALDANIKANLSAIPDGLAILEVDYDKSGDLKQKYGVTMQHTLVQVDAQGTLLNKWSGGNTLASVVEKVK